LKILRVIAISPPRFLILVDVGPRFDLFCRFNRTDDGLSILPFLFVLVPGLTLSWLVADIVRSIRLARRQKRKMSFLMPGLALLLFVESVFVDIFLLLQART
jgi:hypothetical protein